MMKSTIRNIVGVILGWVIGSIINLKLINAGYKVFPVEGLDPDDMESLVKLMPSFGVENFVFPFLAHALGTLFGALIAARITAKHKLNFALGIGTLFLIGGIAMSFILPGPVWFIAVDIIFAYIPMAWIGGMIGIWISNKRGY